MLLGNDQLLFGPAFTDKQPDEPDKTSAGVSGPASREAVCMSLISQHYATDSAYWHMRQLEDCIECSEACGSTTLDDLAHHPTPVPLDIRGLDLSSTCSRGCYSRGQILRCFHLHID